MYYSALGSTVNLEVFVKIICGRKIKYVYKDFYKGISYYTIEQENLIMTSKLITEVGGII